jgi:hypothetical protein
MIWNKATAHNFYDANVQTACMNMIALAARNGGRVALSSLAEFRRGILRDAADIDLVKTAHLARYKPNAYGAGDWQFPGSSNFTVEEYAQAVQNGTAEETERQKIFALIDSFTQRGLTNNIVLTTVFDIALDVRLIVDGFHRATALVILRNAASTHLEALFGSQHSIELIELQSKWAHMLYPCDFLHFCATAP